MKDKPILLCFGTRPEWLKIKPLIKLMDRSEYKLLFTGQHIDLLKNVEVDVNNICTDTQDNLHYYPIDPNLYNKEDLRHAIPGGGEKLTGGDPNVLF